MSTVPTIRQVLHDLQDRFAPFLPPAEWGLADGVLDRVYVPTYALSAPVAGAFETRAALSVFVGVDPVVPLPGADFLTVALTDGAGSGFVSLLVAVRTTTEPTLDATVTIDGIPLELSLARGPLRAVELVDGRHRPTDAPFVVRGQARLELTSGFDVSLTFPGAVDVPAFTIGDTGLVCEVDGFDFTASAAAPALAVERVRLVLPDDLAPPGIVLPKLSFEDVRIDGSGFSGVVNATWPLVATADDRERPYHYAVPGEPAAHLFGLPGGISSVQVTVEDGAVVSSELAGSMLLPWFAQVVAVAVRLGSTDGELDVRLEVRAEGADEIVLTKAELLSLHARSIALEASGSTGVLTLSGGLQPLLWQSEGLTWPRVDVTGLRLEQDLADLAAPPLISFDEAWVDLAELATLDLFGFLFELERVGVGYLADTDALWIDLTGSVRLIDQLPVGLGVDGFRITWPRTLHEDLLAQFGGTDVGELLADPAALLELGARIQVRFAGVHLFYGVPGAVELEGLIRFVKDAQAVGFAGDMALRVPATGLALEAGLLVGMNLAAPPFPFLYVYFGVELPAGIPLGPSGLALKGAKGLFGLNVRPDRTPEQNPYHDWYKRGPLEGAHPTTKWTHERWAVAFGAGVTITTVDGTLLGVSGLLVIALPGPVVFVEGKALVFQGVFPGDGPLSAIGFFDGAAHTVQLNVQVAAELVAGVLDVDAGLEAFFNFDDPTAWHLYLGQDKPVDRRVAARILDLPGVGWLFSGSSYLMLDMADGDTVRGRVGVEIVFEPPPIEIEVVTVRLTARLDGTGQLTLNPFAFDGGLALGAALEIDAYDLVEITASATATVTTHGPRPLVVHAGLHVGVELPVPDLEELPIVGEAIGDAVEWFEEEVAELPEIPQYLELDVPFHMEYPGPPTIEPLVTGVSLLRPLALAERSVTAVPGDVDPDERRAAAGAPVVGLDALPVVSFTQDFDQAGDLHVVGFPGPAARFTAADLRFAPTLRSVELHSAPRTGTGPLAWEPVASLAAPLDDPAAMWASWRPDPEPTDPARTARRVLQCWTANPFAWLVEQPALVLTGATADEDALVPAGPSAVTDRGIGLVAPRGPHRTCVGSAEIEAAGRPYRASGPGDPPLRIDLGGAIVESHDLRVARSGPDWVLLVHGPDPQTVTLRLQLPEPVVELRLRLGPDPALADVRAHRGAACAEQVAVERTTDARGRELLRSAVPFRCVELWAKDVVELQELCWIAAAAARDHATASLQEAATADVVGVGPVAPLLATDRYYRLSVTTSAQLVDDGEGTVIDLLQTLDPAMAEFRERYTDGEETTSTWLFQTDGPPRDLDRYVAWASVAGDAPVYADDDLVFRFRRSTVEQLYPSAVGGAADLPYGLEAVVTAAQGRSVPGLVPRWRSAGSATELPVEQEWRALVDGQSWGPVPAAAGDDVLEFRTSGTLPTLALPGPPGLRLTGETVPVEQRVAALLTADGPPPRRAGPAATGCVLGWQAPDACYVGEIGDYPDGPRLRLLRRHGSATVLLAERPLHAREREQLRSGLRLEVYAARSGPRLTLTATLDHGQPLVGVDSGIDISVDTLAPLTEGRVGTVTTGPRWLTVSRIEIRDGAAGLAPGGRYRLRLVGGEGGRALVDDRFTALNPRWDDPAGAWQVGDGVTAAPGAPLWWLDPLEDDVEVVAHVELHAPDTLAIVLRHPAGRTAAPRSFYEVIVRAGAADTVITSLRAGLDDRIERVVVAAAVRPGAPGHHTLRVRLVADRLRAWLDEQPVLDETLGELTLTVGAPGQPGLGGGGRTHGPRTLPVPPTRSGRFGLRVVAGAPRVRRLRLAPPALAEWSFETARFRSFAALVGSADGRPRRSRAAEPVPDAGWAAALAAAQALADARIHHRAVRVDHHSMVCDRTALEAAALAVRDRESALDQAFDALLAGHPLPADRPTALEVTVLEAGPEDAGDPVAILLLSPETLDPAVAGDPGEHRAAPGTGRTALTLHRRDGGTWTDVASRAVATADGTRLLLRPVDDGGDPRATLQPGMYRLRCERIRDHGDDQVSADVLDHRYDRPQLSAGGRTEPETATLELEV